MYVFILFGLFFLTPNYYILYTISIKALKKKNFTFI